MNNIYQGDLTSSNESVIDDSIALQNAIDAAMAFNQPLTLQAGKTYSIGNELQVHATGDAPILKIIGSNTVFQANDNPNTVLEITANGQDLNYDLDLPFIKPADVAISIIDEFGVENILIFGMDYFLAGPNSNSGTFVNLSDNKVSASTLLSISHRGGNLKEYTVKEDNYGVNLPFSISQELTVNLITDNNSIPLKFGDDYKVFPYERGIGCITFQAKPLSNHKIKIVWKGQRSLMRIENVRVLVEGIQFNANRNASYAVLMQKASGSYFSNCIFLLALIDGFHQAYNVDRAKYERCEFKINGKIFHSINAFVSSTRPEIKVPTSGYVSCSVGNSVVVNGQDTTFDTMGIRKGDFICIGNVNKKWTKATEYKVGDRRWNESAPNYAYEVVKVINNATSGEVGPTGIDAEILDGNVTWKYLPPPDGPAQWLQIERVKNATELICLLHPASIHEQINLGFNIYVGDGHHEGLGRADNNINVHDTNYYAFNAGCGLRVHGLYGVRGYNLQIDANGSYPVCISMWGEGTYCNSFQGIYCEGYDRDGEAFFLGHALGITIDTLSCDGPAYRSSTTLANFGIVRNALLQNPGRINPQTIEPIGEVIDNVLSKNPIKEFGSIELTSNNQMIDFKSINITSNSRVIVTKRQIDRSATDFAIEVVNGCFTIITNNPAEKNIIFDFIILN